jgi:hypothetical protein
VRCRLASIRRKHANLLRAHPRLSVEHAGYMRVVRALCRGSWERGMLHSVRPVRNLAQLLIGQFLRVCSVCHGHVDVIWSCDYGLSVAVITYGLVRCLCAHICASVVHRKIVLLWSVLKQRDWFSTSNLHFCDQEQRASVSAPLRLHNNE